MKSTAAVAGNGKSQVVKVKTKEPPARTMNDPTLEGKDENKVGRFQRKTHQAESVIKR